MNRMIDTLTLFAIALLHSMQPACAQQEDEEPSQRRPVIAELMEEREELRLELEEATEVEQRIRSAMQEIEQLLQLHRKLDKLESALSEDESAEHETQVNRIEMLELKIERLEQIRELRGQQERLQELQEFLADVRPERWSEINAVLSQLEATCSKLRTIAQRLTEETSEDELGASRRMELEDELDAGLGFAELVEEYVWAIEEEEEEALEDLSAEVAEYLIRFKDGQAGMLEVALPELKPVLINEESLKAFKDKSFEEDIVPHLQQYCFDCHSDSSSYGDLNLEKLVAEQPLVVNRDAWVNVIAQVKNRVMPPEDGEPMIDEHRRELVLSLHNKIHDFDYSGIKNPGFETARRLTHSEYDNSLSDLFGVDVRVAARFPKELTGTSGFDNSGNTLFVQPLLMERYLSAADEVIEELLPDVAKTSRQRQAKRTVLFKEPASVSEEASTARQVILRFASRAFRRPLTEGEKTKLVGQYTQLRNSGTSYQESLRIMFQRMLISPFFLLKFETSQPQVTSSASEAFQVDSWEIASRLSYFLWATMPDNELFQLAKEGKLKDPEVLSGQVRRMLADPKAKALGEQFASQWLGFQHVGTRIRLDPIDNPWCTDSLMQAMRDETALFVHALIKDNRPIPQLIDADFTFLNEELAKHYRIRGVVGEQMRRVNLKDPTRGGIIGHASLLAVTSFPYRTSPVVRGKWILDTLLGTPPPPPPPNVSELSDEILENERLSIREKLERHRRLPSCAACHAEMDPLGLALEKYDWFGRYRERYDRRRIDDRGALPTGEEFNGLPGLKQVIADSRMPDLVRQVTRRMLSYALGRQLEYYDEPAVQKIIAELEKNDKKFQTLIEQVVLSYPFRFKQVQSSKPSAAATSSTEKSEKSVPDVRLTFIPGEN